MRGRIDADGAGGVGVVETDASVDAGVGAGDVGVGAPAVLVALHSAEERGVKWKKTTVEHVDHTATHCFRAFHAGGTETVNAGGLADVGSGKVYDG